MGWAPNKRIPDFILLHTDESVGRSFFSAVLSGDGHEYIKREVRNARISTTSKLLAMQLQLISARFGFHLSVHSVNKKRTGRILGRKVDLHEKFEARGQIEHGSRQAMKTVGDFFCTLVREVETFHYSGPVHNLATQDGTYLVSYVVVHNCGAPIAPKFGEMIIMCEYWWSSVTLGSAGWANIQKQTMLPLTIQSTNEISNRVKSMMDRGMLHRHLQESSTLEEMTLSVVPYWLVNVSARTSIIATNMVAEGATVATTAALFGVMAGMVGGRRGGFGAPLLGGAMLGSMMGGSMGGGGGQKKAIEMDQNYNFPIIALKALTQ